jgi:tyrosyl-tRNA synthetase
LSAFIKEPIAMKSVDEQLALIERGAEQIEPRPELRQRLERSIASGKPLRVKYGIDPTGIDVHLGHTVPLRKLRVFQDLGHQAVLIIGNYTALIGDPSGRDQTRQRLTEEQVQKNAEDYLKQIGKILDLSKTEIHRNGDWFCKMTFLDVVALTTKMTVQRMLERDDFTKRREAGEPIYLHECLYPLMQGRDSVEIRADIELGGSEQLFSLMVGRRLQEDAGQPPQVCITLPILLGTDGVRRMGKSLGNYVGVGESAKEQFGKTMRIPDAQMRNWFLLLTDLSSDEVETILAGHPNEAKKTLAADIVAYYHGAAAAAQARADFEKQFSQGQDPEIIEEAQVASSELADGKIGLPQLLVLSKLASSKKDAQRQIEAGAVSVGPDRRKISDWKEQVNLEDGLVIRLGRKIRRIKCV